MRFRPSAPRLGRSSLARHCLHRSGPYIEADLTSKPTLASRTAKPQKLFEPAGLPCMWLEYPPQGIRSVLGSYSEQVRASSRLMNVLKAHGGSEDVYIPHIPADSNEKLIPSRAYSTQRKSYLIPKSDVFYVVSPSIPQKTLLDARGRASAPLGHCHTNGNGLPARYLVGVARGFDGWRCPLCPVTCLLCPQVQTFPVGSPKVRS